MSTLMTSQKSEQLPNLEFSLFDLAQQYFDLLKQEYSGFGIEVNPVTHLHQTRGLLSYYDLQDKQIYLSLSDNIYPGIKLRRLLLRSLLGLSSNNERVIR